MESDFLFQLNDPDPAIADFVESFWLLQSPSGTDKEVIILPDGRIDMTFSRSATEPFHAVLSGIEAHPDKAILKAGTCMMAISFKLLAVEYIFRRPIAGLLNSATYLPDGFWTFGEEDLQDFGRFCTRATQKIRSLLPAEIDNRKVALFHQIYARDGEITVKELSEKVFWSSRQINRYFNDQFGLSLKAYCNILRFRASFRHIKQGKLFPEQNFADQSHFIKEVRKLAGVSPKELNQNHNDRFIQFSLLDG